MRTNLNITLAEFQRVFESGELPYRISPEQLAIMHDFDEKLRLSGILAQILRPGFSFPNFALINQWEEVVELEHLLNRGPVILSFFRGVWCPYCNLELQALQRSVDELEGAGASLVAISPQLPALNKRMVLQHNLRFDVLSDIANRLAEKIGLTYPLANELIEGVFRAFGTDLVQFNGDNSWRLPVSSRFVVDTDGVIVAATADVDFRKRPDPGETLAIVKAMTRRTNYV